MADFLQRVEIFRPRMLLHPPVQPEQMSEAAMPDRIGAAAERQGLRVGLGNDDEAAESDPRQRRGGPRGPRADNGSLEALVSSA